MGKSALTAEKRNPKVYQHCVINVWTNYKMKQPKVLTEWEKATEKLTRLFLERYFGDEPSDWEYYWVAGEIGRVLYINDSFFDLDRIVEAIKYKATPEQLFDYQELEIDLARKNKKPEVNFRNYLKLNEAKK